MMVAKEAHTSPSMKDLIAATSGVGIHDGFDPSDSRKSNVRLSTNIHPPISLIPTVQNLWLLQQGQPSYITFLLAGVIAP
jgi:enoyl reductase-like protein